MARFAEPSVSVALCTFNGARHVAAQLTSILDQTRPPDEILVADDASTDDTAAVVRRLAAAAAARQTPIPVDLRLNEQNLGFIANFQQVLSRCRGDVVFLSDQDDVWLPRKIATMLAPFRNDPDVGLVYCDARLAGPDLQPLAGTLFGARRAMALDRRRDSREVVRQVGINGCTMAVRRSLLDWMLPIPGTWGHDHWIALLAHALGEVVPITEPLMLYRRHTGTAGNDPQLEGGAAKVWAAGMRHSGPGAYAAEVIRWRDVSRHLEQLRQATDVPAASRLDEWADECRRRLEFAEARLQVKRVPRVRRFAPWLRLVRGGGHGRYLHGARSALKDLLL